MGAGDLADYSVRPEQPQFPTDPRRAPAGLSQILGRLRKEEFLQIPIAKTVQHEFPAANGLQQHTISSEWMQGAHSPPFPLLGLSRAGRAIPVRCAVRPLPPAPPDSALPLVRKSPRGGADLPPHPATHATISSLGYPPLSGGTRETPRHGGWWSLPATRCLPP